MKIRYLVEVRYHRASEDGETFDTLLIGRKQCERMYEDISTCLNHLRRKKLFVTALGTISMLQNSRSRAGDNSFHIIKQYPSSMY